MLKNCEVPLALGAHHLRALGEAPPRSGPQFPGLEHGEEMPSNTLSTRGPGFLCGPSAACCTAGSRELPLNPGHVGQNALLIFQQDLLPHGLPTCPAKRKPERLNAFIKGAALEVLGGCEGSGRQIKGKL